MRLAIWVESFMGYGHALRALNFARVFSDCKTMILSGSIAGSRLLENRLGRSKLVRLTTILAERTCNDLQREEKLMDEILDLRIDQAWAALRQFKPTVMVFEYFPFSRKRFKREIIVLITRLQNGFPECTIVSSVRDIPPEAVKTKRAGKKIKRILDSAFDLVVVHGDKDIVDVTMLIPGLGKTKVPIVYTGYLGNEDDVCEWTREGPLVIDLGGGWESGELIEPILKWIKDMETARFNRVVILSGRFVSGNLERYDGLVLTSGVGKFSVEVEVELDTPKGRSGVRTASACITRMGYNAGVDALRSRIPVKPLSDLL